MFHGGTNPGFMAGANWDDGYKPDTTSYDYDAPLNEAGEPTAKFDSFRSAIQTHLGTKLPEMPKPIQKISIPSFELKPFADLRQAIVRTVKSDKPKTMEELDQAYGYVLYQKTAGPFEGELRIEGLSDYALILADGKPLGELMRSGQKTLKVNLRKETKLEIIVHNLGRINFGHKLPTERKGILGGIYLGDEELLGWESCSIPCENLKQIKQVDSAGSNSPTLFRGSLELKTTGDTYLDMSNWGIGAVWINGRNVGRYWHIGAQKALFVPGVWLKKGKNEIVVLDLLDKTERSIKGVLNPIWSKD
jgi:beta-galactosidase